MNETGQKIFYSAVLVVIPFLIWIVPYQQTHFITALLIVIIFIFSKYLKSLIFLHNTFEIIILFFSLEFILTGIGSEKLFLLNHLITLTLLYFFLLRLKKHPAARFFLRFGNIKGNLLISLLFALFSVLGLTIWFLSRKHNPYAELIPATSTMVLIPMGFGFALINALYEEGIFRSILLSCFTQKTGFAVALVIQAIWFSLLHFQAGFPSGEIGVLLTFVFGLMMGYLVKRTDGIFMAISIHFLADLTVFVLIVLRMKGHI